MGDWYEVVKTIKGHRYCYRQRTWREGGRVRTQSQYLGPARGGNGSAAPVNTTSQATVEVAAERQLISDLFDPAKASQGWNYGWAIRGVYRPDAETFALDPGLMRMGPAMGVAMVSRAPFDPSVELVRENGAWYLPSRDRLQIPDHTVFRADGENTVAQSFAHTLLHELAHATRFENRSPRARPSYAHEEMVAEITACLVARRIGIGYPDIKASAYYVQLWFGRSAAAGSARVHGEREALRAADYLTAIWTKVNTTKNG